MAKGKRNQQITLIGFIVCAICLIALLPRRSSISFEYDIGHIWKHNDLIADIDFPLLKTEAEQQQERHVAELKKKLYFRFNTKAEEESIEKLDELIASDTQWHEREKQDALSKGMRIIKKTSKQQLISLPLEQTEPDASHIIYVLHEGNKYEEKLYGDFISIASWDPAKELSLITTDTSISGRLAYYIKKSIVPSLTYDEGFSEKMHQEYLRNRPVAKGIINKGEIIIRKGETITLEKQNLLNSYKTELAYQNDTVPNQLAIWIGQVLFIGTFLLLLFLFLVLFRQKISRDYRKAFSILSLILFIAGLSSLAWHFQAPSVYIVPFAILPILIRSFFDTRMALFAHIITLILVVYFADNSTEFLILQIGAGLVALFTFINFRKRSQLYTSAILIWITYSAIYTSLQLMREGSFQALHYSTYIWFLISCIGVLFALPLIYIFEKVFGLVGELSLLELTDTNNRLLRELSHKAPGTFHHSVQVANLAEAAIEEIGGNSLLLRAGALYHDIGKIIKSQFFIENQVPGSNPHDRLSFEESAEVIISHITFGVELGRKYRLPDIVIDFIRTHHGTLTVQYFYKNYVKSFPDAASDIEKFSYPGPVPHSREMAVLMMADSVEAASRSIQDPNLENLTQLVNKIINYQLSEKQYIHSELTLKDIERIRQIFVRHLLNLYHVRVEYPE
ncbi:MAG: HDIG domain-containing protein [Flavobacteriales bacterium]|nr:HDIG domain-containing protein [Flavobacteriales bacterium]